MRSLIVLGLVCLATVIPGVTSKCYDCYTFTAADIERIANGETEDQVCSSYNDHITTPGDDCTCFKVKGCYTGEQNQYTGTWSKTVSGRECQRWDQQTPHAHTRCQDSFVYPVGETYVTAENYCRNPDGEAGIWCYTTDPDKRWELCGIPEC